MPPLQRLPPSALTVPAWGAALGFTALTWRASTRVTIVLPPAPGLPGGYRYEADTDPRHQTLLVLAVTSIVTLIGSALLRRAPLPALGLLVAGCCTTTLAVHSPLISMYFLPADIALYLIAARQPRRTANTAAVMTAGMLACYTLLRLLPATAAGWLDARLAPADPPGSYLSVEFAVILPCVIFWLVGSANRQAREHAQSLAAQSATAERLRISRELHDSVAHNIGIIAVLAGAAGRVMHSQPAETRQALEAIETTSRDTLTGLQRMLRAMRHAESGSAEAVPLEASPGLRDLDRITALASGAGVRVDVTWRGERRALPPDIDLSVFRIIQEAVTNVVRHSGAHTCRVDLGFDAGEVSIEVVDGGPGRHSSRSGLVGPPAGHGRDGAGGGDGGGGGGGGAVGAAGGLGLVGMRERVAMLSGQFSAGPLPGGGFRVAARIPA